MVWNSADSCGAGTEAAPLIKDWGAGDGAAQGTKSCSGLASLPRAPWSLEIHSSRKAAYLKMKRKEMEQFNLSKREGFQGFQAKSPSAAQSNFNWIYSLFAGWADSLWHLKARFESTGWGHSWTGDVHLSHSFFCVFYTRQSEEGEVLPLHPWSTWVLLWWAPGQIHVHNST